MRGKTDTNAGLVPLLNLLLIVAWAQGGRDYARVNWLFFLPIASLCVYIIFFTATSDITSDYASALNVAQLFFVASATILLRHHQPELRQIGQNKVTAEMSFYERLKWAVSLLLTPRGVGWSFEPTDHLPPKPNSSRLRFIFTQLKWIAFYALMFDVVSMFIRANPCFGTGGPSLAAFGWVWRSTSWLYILVAYAPMSLLYASLSIASVGLGFSKPHHWPHLFGTPRDAYTLRNCWGRVWHQMLRKVRVIDISLSWSSRSFSLSSSPCIRTLRQPPSTYPETHSPLTSNYTCPFSFRVSFTTLAITCSTRTGPVGQWSSSFYKQSGLPSKMLWLASQKRSVIQRRHLLPSFLVFVGSSPGLPFVYRSGWIRICTLELVIKV